MATEISWKDEPGDEDYEAALAFLELLVTPTTAQRVVDRLRDAEVTKRKADDIWRAAGGLCFGESIEPVSGELSPVLLVVGGDIAAPLIIVGGLRSVYTALGDEGLIPTKLTHLP